MSIHFTSMTVSQITDRAHKLMDEGTALAQLAAALAEFENTTGRKLFVSEADQGVEHVGTPRPDRGLTIPTMAGLVEVAPTGEATGEPEPKATAPRRQAEPKALQTLSAPAPDPAPPTTAPKRADRPWGALSLAERRIVQHLERLPRTFTTAEDLRLVELLTSGHKTPIAAAIMDMPVDQVVARWQAFMCPDVLGPNGKASIDGQKALLAALRYRKDSADA